MNKAIKMGALLLVLLALLTGCTANGAEAPSASESPAATEAATPHPGHTPDEAQADVFRLVGEAAVITVGGQEVAGSAYYVGKDETDIAFPLGAVCKALGWMVAEPDSSGVTEMRLTREGDEDISINYTRPANNVHAGLEGITVTKGTQPVDITGMKLPFIDGMLYADKAFMDKAVQAIDVSYDGATAITIQAKK
ncbi:MAG: hypothetical protein LBN04_08950 [Oscillospiraceae bacterium]|jgi:hypothetical protein|nr:hypothetical protein [Oscillospiraceae bacterium]